jgi:putative transposase
MFAHGADYASFCDVLAEGLARERTPLYAWCLMPNHWHLVLRASDGANLARLMHWVTTKHAAAWHGYRETTGEGHLYQGRYKAFAIAADEHFLVVCRYVERNPVRAGLVEDAAAWRWSSHRAHVDHPHATIIPSVAEWPVRRPADWREWVDLPQSDSELAHVRASVRRGIPFGSARWATPLLEEAKKRGIEFRPRGRPPCRRKVNP